MAMDPVEITQTPQFRTFTLDQERGRRKLEEREIEGHASVFDVTDAYGTRLLKGAFKESVRDKFSSGKVKFLFNHMTSQIPGKLTDLREDKDGLFFRAKFSDTPLGNQTLTLIRDGALTDLSIGFSVRELGEFNEEDGFLEIRKVDLWEVSVVTFGANEEALVEDFRSQSDPRDNMIATLSDELRGVRGELLALSHTLAEPCERGTSQTEVDDTNRSSENKDDEEDLARERMRSIARARQGQTLGR